MSELNLDRKQIVIRRMLQSIDEYTGAFVAPMPMKILSAKFSRALMEFGGLPEVIHELKTAGMLNVYLTKSGAKVVLPENSTLVPADAVRI